MKNRKTWEFAHRYCGRLWYISGIIMLPVSVLAMFFTMGKSEDYIGIVGAIVCIVQLVLLIGAIITTEKALKKNFDREGNIF